MTIKSTLALLSLLVLCPLYTYSHGVAIVNATSETYFELNSTEVNVTVENQIAVIKSYQKFYNNTNSDTRLKYAFPVPSNANPISLRWKVNGEEWKEAQVSGENQDPTLPGAGGPGSGGGGGGSGGVTTNNLEDYLGPNALYFDLADTVLVGQSIEFEFSYVELLPYSFGIVSFNFPNNYNLIQNNPVANNLFTFDLISEREIESLAIDQYTADISNNLSNTASILQYESQNEILTSDYNITYELKSDQLGVYSMSTFLPDSLVTCDEFGRGFVSLIIEPESNADVDVIEKNFTLIIDKSGSMIGDKIVQAQEAAAFIVNNLNEGDNFNIISFSSTIESFSPGHVEFNIPNQIAALDYIDDITAAGATNIDEALTTSIQQFNALDPEKANIIIFFTDGLATAGQTNTQGILDNVEHEILTAETNVFLFTFGIGDGVDIPLLTLLARENNGLVSFLEDQELEEEITSFFLKINNPVLINTSITISPEESIQSIHPSLAPNLYKGQQLIISGRYATPGPVNIVLEGTAFNLPVSYDFPITLSDSTVTSQSFLPKIWAKQKIDELSIDYNLASSFSQEIAIQSQIDELSECYAVVSVAFGSFTDTALEVEMESFEVDLEKDEVHLNWVTTIEINNDEFVIERSIDGHEYEEIGKVAGAGTSTDRNEYEFIDREPVEGANYYRLKQIDIDGNISYSEVKIIVINSRDDARKVAIYPNPIQHGDDLFIDTNIQEEINIEIIDATGRRVYIETMMSQEYLETPELIQGTYICNVCAGGKVFSFKLFVK